MLQLCPDQNDRTMHMFGYFKRRREQDFESLLHLLTDRTDNGVSQEDFIHICSYFSTGHVSLDNMIYDSLGMSGEEVMALLHGKCEAAGIKNIG